MAWHSTDVPVAVRAPPLVEQAVCGRLFPQVHYLVSGGGLKTCFKALEQLACDCVTYL